MLAILTIFLCFPQFFQKNSTIVPRSATFKILTIHNSLITLPPLLHSLKYWKHPKPNHIKDNSTFTWTEKVGNYSTCRVIIFSGSSVLLLSVGSFTVVIYGTHPAAITWGAVATGQDKKHLSNKIRTLYNPCVKYETKILQKTKLDTSLAKPVFYRRYYHASSDWTF